MLFLCVNFFSHSLVDGYLNDFQFYLVTKHANYKHFCMYLLVHISSHDVHAQLCEVMPSHFLRWLCSLHSEQSMKASGSSEPHRPMEMSNFKMFASLMGMNWYLAFLLVFP